MCRHAAAKNTLRESFYRCLASQLVRLSDFLAEETHHQQVLLDQVQEDDCDSGLGDSPPPTPTSIKSQGDPPIIASTMVDNVDLAEQEVKHGCENRNRSHSFLLERFLDRFHSGMLQEANNGSRNNSSSANPSPCLSEKFRHMYCAQNEQRSSSKSGRLSIVSAMPAIDDHDSDGDDEDDDDLIGDVTMGDDDAIEAAPQETKSMFLARFWSWIQTRWKRRKQREAYCRLRKSSVEQHAKRRFGTRSPDLCSHHHQLVLQQSNWMNNGQHSQDALTKSWAGLGNDLSYPHSGPPSSLVVTTGGRSRSISHAQPSLFLHPPPLVVPVREHSLESGYLSHSNSNSTPCSPRSSIVQSGSSSSSSGGNNKRPQFGRCQSKSVSEDDGTISPSSNNAPSTGYKRAFIKWRSEDSSIMAHPHNNDSNFNITTAREKRKQFYNHANYNVFNEVTEDDVKAAVTSDDDSSEVMSRSVTPCRNHPEDIPGSLGEWSVPHAELSFGKKLVDGQSYGHEVYAGRWHGDVVIHTFRVNRADKRAVDTYLDNVKSLMHVRHENIVSFMGASSAIGNDNQHTYTIITNPVRAESLHHIRSNAVKRMDVATKMSIAKQVANALGYLHAKDIVHGRICSRNIFLEHKVQLSLLDYAVCQSNSVYSSPQLISMDNGAERISSTKADDVFAFGTLLYEIFHGRLPLENESDEVIEREILSGRIPRQLKHIECTDKLKKLIQSCWEYDPSRRPSILEMVAHFQPGSCLLRRHSTSEPRLDQLEKLAVHARH